MQAQTQPLVSVVLPTYNRAPLLRRAIDSVLRQSCPDFELIVIDDASQDETERILANIGDPRLRILRHVQNRGSAAARNTGIAASRAEWIAFQDSDDEWLPEKLERQLAMLRYLPAETGLVYSSFIRINGARRQVVPSRLRQFVSRFALPRWRLSGGMPGALSRGNFITTSAVLVRKACLETFGSFDEHLPRLQDWDLWLRLAQHCLFGFIRTPLLFRYATPGNISSDSAALLKAFEMILEKRPAKSKEWRWIFAQARFAHGDWLARAGRLSESRAQMFSAWTADPVNPVYWASALTILAGIDPYLRLSSALGMGYEGK